MTIKNIVVINGKEVEVKDLPDAELLAEKLNRKALTARYEKNHTSVDISYRRTGTRKN